MALVLAEELAKQPILTPNHVLLLRQYIGSKYPNHGPKSQAMVFANAIHQVLDRELVTFQDNLRQIIKNNLLNDLFSKEHFLLTAKDVFDSILNANALLVQGFNAVTTWLANRLNDIPEELLIQALDNHLNENQSNQNNPSPLSELLADPLSELFADPLSGSLADPHYDGSHKCIILPLDSIPGSPAQNLHNQKNTTLIKNRIKLPDINIIVSRQWVSAFMSYLQLATIAAMIGFALWMFNSGEASYWMTQAGDFVETHMPNIPLLGKEETAPQATNSAVAAVVLSESLKDTPLDIRYQPVNPLLLAEWLTRRESILAKKSYIDAILIAAEENDVNPLVLIAIAGQEQGFVPADHPQASKIANNPFNVFGSWQAYNTTISESAHIAARTVNRLSKDCPKDVDPLLWVNRSYAQDQNWWRGVRDILTQLQNDIQNMD